jgi:CheY-like chemotaxis protein
MAEKLALIIDDDAANCAIWELVLTEKGYRVLTAADAASGMRSVSDNISLYLVDYHLPDGHGTDIIREGIRAGGNVFMVKPTSPSVMGQLLSEIESGDLTAKARQLINRHGRRTYAS